MSDRLVRILLIISCIAAVLVATGAEESGGSKATQATDWRLGYDQKFDFNLNPLRAQLTSSYFVFTVTYDLFPYNWRLKDAGPDYKYSPVLSHEVSPDGLTYTFHMRHGMKWNDGKPITADDAVFSYEAAKNVGVSVLAGYVESMKSIKALDDYTVRYTLQRPDARVLSAYVPLLPKHIWGKMKYNEMGTFEPCCPLVGSGPYMITHYDSKGTTIFKPNPYFYGPPGQIKRILMIKYGDKEAQLRDIKLNALDAVLSGEAGWVQNVESDPSLTAWSIPVPGFTSIAFNMCPPGGGDPKNTCTGPAPGVKWQVVQDPAIRQALSWAIDREALVTNVYRGQAEPGNGLISPFYQGKGYYESFAGDPEVGYTYDPDKARQILKDGGWDCPPAGTEGVCTKDGRPAEFELLTRTEVTEQQNAAKLIVAWAADVGIKINATPITSDALIDRNYATSPEDKNKYQPDYDAFLWGWGGDSPSPDFNFEPLMCGNYWSDSFYCNPEYDPLPRQALETLDFDQRVEYMHEAERIALRDAPYIILVHDAEIQVTRNDTWTGYVPSPEPNGYPFSSSSGSSSWT